jgi:hypothetical protein
MDFLSDQNTIARHLVAVAVFKAVAGGSMLWYDDDFSGIPDQVWDDIVAEAERLGDNFNPPQANVRLAIRYLAVDTED